jgi:hypothetical protein
MNSNKVILVFFICVQSIFFGCAVAQVPTLSYMYKVTVADSNGQKTYPQKWTDTLKEIPGAWSSVLKQNIEEGKLVQSIEIENAMFRIVYFNNGHTRRYRFNISPFLGEGSGYGHAED